MPETNTPIDGLVQIFREENSRDGNRIAQRIEENYALRRSEEQRLTNKLNAVPPARIGRNPTEMAAESAAEQILYNKDATREALSQLSKDMRFEQFLGELISHPGLYNNAIVILQRRGIDFEKLEQERQKRIQETRFEYIPENQRENFLLITDAFLREFPEFYHPLEVFFASYPEDLGKGFGKIRSRTPTSESDIIVWQKTVKAVLFAKNPSLYHRVSQAK